VAVIESVERNATPEESTPNLSDSDSKKEKKDSVEAAPPTSQPTMKDLNVEITRLEKPKMKEEMHAPRPASRASPSS
jgi:hypothetical protein